MTRAVSGHRARGDGVGIDGVTSWDGDRVACGPGVWVGCAGWVGCAEWVGVAPVVRVGGAGWVGVAPVVRVGGAGCVGVAPVVRVGAPTVLVGLPGSALPADDFVAEEAAAGIPAGLPVGEVACGVPAASAGGGADAVLAVPEGAARIGAPPAAGEESAPRGWAGSSLGSVTGLVRPGSGTPPSTLTVSVASPVMPSTTNAR